MPCYLFTFHGYGTWLPDNPRGYVRRKEGVLVSDVSMAEYYRQNQAEETACFETKTQQLIIDTARKAFEHQQLRGHSIVAEATHVHVLVSWKTNRTWQLVRQQLRASMTRRLNQEVERRSWFSKQASRKRVKDRSHFEYLVQKYLPGHRGLKWSEERGVYR